MIAIKGMKMPTHCTECDFWHDGVFEHCLLNMEVQNEDVPFNEGEYPDGCPLIEIPPHGDLIDRDALMKQIEHDTPLSDVFEKTIRRYLKNAPTVIEAEEG